MVHSGPMDMDKKFPVSTRSSSRNIDLHLQNMAEQVNCSETCATTQSISNKTLCSNNNLQTFFMKSVNNAKKICQNGSRSLHPEMFNYDFKARGMCCNNSYLIRSQNYPERQFVLREITEPCLVKVKYKNLEIPPKMKVEFKDIEPDNLINFQGTLTTGNISTGDRNIKTLSNVNSDLVQDQLVLPSNVQNTKKAIDYTSSSMLSIWEAIDELECEIQCLKRTDIRNKSYINSHKVKMNDRNMPRPTLSISSKSEKSEKQDETRRVPNVIADSTPKTVENPHQNSKTNDLFVIREKGEKYKVDVENFLDKKDHKNSNVNDVTTPIKNPAWIDPKETATSALCPYNAETSRTGESFCDIDTTQNATQPHTKSSTSSLHKTSELKSDFPESNMLHASSEYGTTDDTLPSVVERFLEDALGDELNNTSVTYTQPNVRETISHYNASELISEVESIDEKKNLSMPPAFLEAKEYSVIFGRTRTLYGSVTRKLRKTLRLRAKDGENVIGDPILLPKKKDHRVQKLLEELNVQETLLYQTSKAVNLCYIKKDFTAGPEHVASERLLLLIDLKKKAVLEELKHLSERECSSEQGEVIIRNIALTLKNDRSLDGERHFKQATEWFVVTVSHGSTVWASQPTQCILSESKIVFPDLISVPNLTPDFKIIVRIYSLQTKKLSSDHENLNSSPNRRKWLCSSIRRVWGKKQESITRKHSQILSSTIRSTSFVESGYLELMLRDIPLCSPWTLLSVPETSVLDGNIALNLACKLHISVTHAGFLTHGDEIGGYAVWNRRWCVLEGHCLKFWNYPQEQESIPPIMCINLMHCLSNEISAIDRRLCAKRRTLLIKTARPRSAKDQNNMTLECNREYTIVRNLLSCDTVNDLMEWILKLNHVISILHKWKAIVTYSSTDMSKL